MHCQRTNFVLDMSLAFNLNVSIFLTFIPCFALQAAFDWIWNDLLPELQKERFQLRNITIQFLDDVFEAEEPSWLDAEFLFDFNGKHACHCILTKDYYNT